MFFFFMLCSLFGERYVSVVKIWWYMYLYINTYTTISFATTISLSSFFCLKICKYQKNEYICTVSEGVLRRFWLNLFKFVTKSLPKKKTSLQGLDYNGVTALSFKSPSLRNKHWILAYCKINTRLYTQKCKVGCFIFYI